jgi:hypothetical protein
VAAPAIRLPSSAENEKTHRDQGQTSEWAVPEAPSGDRPVQSSQRSVLESRFETGVELPYVKNETQAEDGRQDIEDQRTVVAVPYSLQHEPPSEVFQGIFLLAWIADKGRVTEAMGGG